MNSDTVIFRADGNKNIGTGHIMRCLSIADSFTAKGYRPVFILADDNPVKLISDRGFETRVLDSNYADMEGELPKWEGLPLLDRNFDVKYLIVDSYYATESYFSGLRKLINNAVLVYMDDLAAFPYPVDVLINYNAFGPDVDYAALYNGRRIPKMILGPEYVPLRSQFKGVPERIQNKEAKKILFSTGGADPYHMALRLVKRIADDHPVDEKEYHFLIGAMNSDKDELCLLTKTRTDIIIHENVTDMKSLICDMDICVSASGSTLYEICACGVPVITYVLADNQFRGAEAFEKLKVAEYAGDIRILRDPAKTLIEDAEKLLSEYGNACRSLLTGMVQTGSRKHLQKGIFD